MLRFGSRIGWKRGTKSTTTTSQRILGHGIESRSLRRLYLYTLSGYYEHSLGLNTNNHGRVGTATADRFFSTRSSPSSSNDTKNERHREQRKLFLDLDDVTDSTLNVNKYPLGTLTEQAWHETDMILKSWQQHQKLSGYALDSMEKLLQRLIYEQAATTNPSTSDNFHNKPSAAAAERDLLIAEWQHAILHGWILLSQKQNDRDTDMIALIAERAESVLGKIVEWYNQGGYWASFPDGQDPLPVSDFVLLVNQWLRVDDKPSGTIRAVDLLMTWTEGEHATSLLEDYKEDVVMCFNDTLKQSTDMLHRKEDHSSLDMDGIRKSTALLVDRMNLLRESGWSDGLDQISELARKTILLERLKTANDDDQSEESVDMQKSSSRSFEVTAVYRQMVELISVADENDLETITEDVIPRLKAARDIPLDVARDVITALTDFFIRIKDAKQATFWLQRMDRIILTSSSPQDGDDTDTAILVDRLKAVLGLWTEEVSTSNTDQQGPLSRASEIEMRLEELQGGTEHTDLTLVIRMWLNSMRATNVGPKRMRKMFQKLGDTWKNGAEIELTNIDVLLTAMAGDTNPVSIPEPAEMDVLTEVVKSKWEEMSPDMHKKTAETLVGALMNYQMSSKAALYLKECVLFRTEDEESDLLPSLRAKLLRSSLPELPTTGQRIELVEKLGGLEEGSSSTWDLECYNAAIPFLFRHAKDGDGSDTVANKLLNIALDRIVDGSLVEDESCSIGSFIQNVIVECGRGGNKEEYQYKANLVAEVLLQAENKLLSLDRQSPIRTRFPSSPIPEACFTHVITRLALARENAKAKGTFMRLFEYYKLGKYGNLLPSKPSLDRYIDALDRSKDNTPAERAKRMENVLFDWLDATESGNPDVVIKFTRRDFEIIFGAYKRDKTAQAKSAALDLLDKVLPLKLTGQISKNDASFFLNWGIQLARKSIVHNNMEVIVERFVRKYVVAKKYKLDPDDAVWKTIMSLPLESKLSEHDGALKATVLALTEMRRRNGKAEVWAYELYLKSVRRNATGLNLVSKLATAGFESCCEDGLLTPHLTEWFQQIIKVDQWHAIYTTKLSSDGASPGHWSRNIKPEKNKGTSESRASDDDNNNNNRKRKHGPKKRKSI